MSRPIVSSLDNLEHAARVLGYHERLMHRHAETMPAWCGAPSLKRAYEEGVAAAEAAMGFEPVRQP